MLVQPGGWREWQTVTMNSNFSHLSFNSYRKIAKTTLALCNAHICAKTLKTDCKNYNFRYLRFDENVMILTCDSLRTLIELR